MKLRNIALSILAVLVFSLSAPSQSAQLMGIVKLKNADGSTSPAAKYNVDIYRTDINLGEWHVQTDKSGHWSAFVNAIAGTYMIVYWGPGRAPTYQSSVRGSTSETLGIDLDPGDGRKISKQEVLDAIKGAKTQGGAAAPTPSPEEIKQQQEEAAKSRAAAEKAKADFDKMKQHFEQANKLYDANDYSGAIAEYKEAAALDSTQHVVFARLAQTTYNYGVNFFNKGDRDQAEKLWQESAEAGQKAVSLQATNTTYKQILAQTLTIYGSKYGKPDLVDQGCDLYMQLGDAATSNADKANAYNKAGKTYFDAGNPDKSIEAYNKTIAIDANNVPATFGIGVAMVSTGEEAKIKEGLNLLAKVVEIGQPNSQEVGTAKLMIQQIKEAYNFMPQPGKTPPKKKP